MPETKVVGQKRKVDYATLLQWVEPGARVLDLGCGRGILLHDLYHAKGIYGVGVDLSSEKILGCVKRGVSAYQGDIMEILPRFPEGYFDWVVLSRTLHELDRPREVVQAARRVGKRMAVGFANFGYWKNRIHVGLRGSHIRNEVYPQPWWLSRPGNPTSIREFEAFCFDEKIPVGRRVFLRGDWKTDCSFCPAWFAGYAIYELLGSATASAHSGHRP